MFTPNLTDSCSNYDDFRRITTCFQKMVPVIHSSLLNSYLKKCQILLDQQSDSEKEVERLRTIVKCSLFLSYKIWSGEQLKIIKNLLLSASRKLNLLSVEEMALLHSVRYLYYKIWI